MSNFSKQENRLKLSRIDYVIIICYSVITFLSFILDNPIVYLFLGLVMLGVYLYKITKAPANVLSLSLLAGHPFSYGKNIVHAGRSGHILAPGRFRYCIGILGSAAASGAAQQH